MLKRYPQPSNQFAFSDSFKTNCVRQILPLVIVLFLLSCSRAVFKQQWTSEKAPSTFQVRFETSKGNFDLRITRDWSPLAADRFYQLVRHHYFDSGVFYRVVPNFVAQFGSSDTVQSSQWSKYKIPDEAVLHGNKRGSISFARSGKETRSGDLFINLKDNPRLDTINYNGVTGFPSFGEVTNGMDVVDALYSGYGDKTMSHVGTLQRNRKQFLSLFPGIDTIRKAYILKN